MKIKLLAVGTRMPAWVESAVEEYRKRLPADFSLHIREIPSALQGKNPDIRASMEKEAQAMQRSIEKNDYVVALDVRGKSLSTEKLATRLQYLRDEARDLALLVGGADGLDESCVLQADERWSLSALTFPHPLVRVIVAEQLYRAWSLLQGHPYHRQ